MWRAVWKAAIGHRARLTISVLTVAFSVGFIVATLVFTDSLDRAFGELFEDTFAGFDLQVRSEVEPGLDFAVPAPLDAGLLATVRQVPGVEQAQGSVTGFLQLIDGSGNPVETGGPPTFGLSWPEIQTIAEPREGRPPERDDEIAVDAATAARIGAQPGDRLRVIGLGNPEPVTLTGTVGFGDADSAGGVISVFLTVPAAQKLFDLDGRYSTIEVVAAEGVDADALIARLEPALPDGVEAVSVEALARQQVEGFKEAIGFIRTFVLVFGGVALFVGSFVISNTFRITVAQRTRELALMRAIGAGARQVTVLVMGEAVVIALIASFTGLGFGIGLAVFLRWLLGRTGLALPSGPLELTAGTALVAVATGTLVTLVAAVIPAWKASQVPPVAAMREGLVAAVPRRLRTLGLIGAPLTAAGLSMLAAGLLADLPGPLEGRNTELVGAGAGALFIGVAVLTAAFARPLAGAVGRPLRVTGVSGVLARENAMRNPGRTAATASALMIGVTLVGLVTILASSTQTTADRLLADRFRADLILIPGSFSSFGFSPEVARRVAAVEGVEVAAPLRRGQILIGDDTRLIAAGPPEELDRVVRYVVEAGSIADVGGDSLGIRSDAAGELGVGLGDMLTVTFGATGDVPLRVAAIYAADGPPSPFLIDLDTYAANFAEGLDAQVFVRFAPGADPEATTAAVEAAIADFPGIEVQDQDAFRTEATSRIQGLVNVLYGLLGVAVVIAVFGVVGTLLLSVVERTREIGLLRAVGMSRRQVRRMITAEAVVIAGLGGILGTVLAVFLGWAVVETIGEELILDMPVGRLLASLGIAGLLGVLAAVYPAWRASRLNVLAAIAYE